MVEHLAKFAWTNIYSKREYRLHNQQLQIINKSPKLTVPMLRATIAACSSEEMAICERARALVKNPATKTIIKGLLQQYSTTPDAIKDAFGPAPLQQNVMQVIDDMLYGSFESGKCMNALKWEGDHNSTDVGYTDLQDPLPKLLGLVNHFNVPLFQIKLRAFLNTASQSSSDFPKILVTFIVEGSKATASPLPEIWDSLLLGIPPEQALQVSHCLHLLGRHQPDIGQDL